MNYEKLIGNYEKACEKALTKLTEKVQPELQKSCEEWGFEFYAGNGTWFISIQDFIFQNKVVEYYEYVDTSVVLLEFLEPELIEGLVLMIDHNNSLGNQLETVRLQRENYEYVGIAYDDESEIMTLLTSTEFESVSDNALEDKYYYGLITRQIAEAIIDEYSKDKDSAIEVLECLPCLN